jgi:hypothetical protein
MRLGVALTTVERAVAAVRMAAALVVLPAVRTALLPAVRTALLAPGRRAHTGLVVRPEQMGPRPACPGQVALLPAQAAPMQRTVRPALRVA